MSPAQRLTSTQAAATPVRPGMAGVTLTMLRETARERGSCSAIGHWMELPKSGNCLSQGDCRQRWLPLPISKIAVGLAAGRIRVVGTDCALIGIGTKTCTRTRVESSASPAAAMVRSLHKAPASPQRVSRVRSGVLRSTAAPCWPSLDTRNQFRLQIQHKALRFTHSWQRYAIARAHRNTSPTA